MARPMQERPRWTEVEDWVLFECKRTNLDLPWPDIAKLTELDRSGKSCRERWKYHLDPDVKIENFSQEEDDSIICFQSLYGNSWSSIAAHLPGRTDNDVKNRWHNHLKKKQLGRSTGDQPHTTLSSQPQYRSKCKLKLDSYTGFSLTRNRRSLGEVPGISHTQLFHLNHNIDPNASASSIPTLVSASQEIANPWSTSLPSDDVTVHHSFGGDYFEPWISGPFSASPESEFMPTEEVIRLWSA